jgi:preprotein translocase subunit SecY
VFGSIGNIFKVAELRKKVLITLSLLVVYRIGSYIPTPGIDTKALGLYFEELTRAHGQTFLGMMNLFTGGALRRLSIFALGIMPYISASIIMQLLTAVIPFLEKLAREGRAGYEKINQYTRYLTMFLCAFQGFMLSKWLETLKTTAGDLIIPSGGLSFELITVATLACGTVFIMWLGEQIQERGIGNGISIIIATSIISRIPSSLYYLWILYSPLNPADRQISTLTLVSLIALWILVVVAVVFFTQAQRRIPIQYARRVVGRRVYGGRFVSICRVLLPLSLRRVSCFFLRQLSIFFPSHRRFLGSSRLFSATREYGITCFMSD